MTDLTGYDVGDRATAVAYTLGPDGDYRLGSLRIEEVGEAAFEHWPEALPGKAVLMVYPGALDSADQELQAWYYAQSDGTCLNDATTGEPYESGFGGIVPQFFALDAGTTEIQATDLGCDGEPGIDPVAIDAAAGERWLLLPYVTEGGELDFLTLELGAE